MNLALLGLKEFGKEQMLSKNSFNPFLVSPPTISL